MRRVEASELTGPLLRAGRALADVSAEHLAQSTKLGLATIKRAEASEGVTRLTSANAERILEVYERLGVIFVQDEAVRSGVHLLRKSGR